MPWSKYSKAKIAECEEWVSKHGLTDYGGATLKEYCKEMDIDNKTHYHWLKVKDDYREAIERAKEYFKRTLTHDLTISLAEAAKGYEREEIVTDYVPNPTDGSTPIIRSMRKRKVHYPPNVGAAIFLLTNLDPEHYQNRQRNDIAVKKDEEKEMTLEEINAEIARLEKLDK